MGTFINIQDEKLIIASMLDSPEIASEIVGKQIITSKDFTDSNLREYFIKAEELYEEGIEITMANLASRIMHTSNDNRSKPDIEDDIFDIIATGLTDKKKGNITHRLPHAISNVAECALRTRMVKLGETLIKEAENAKKRPQSSIDEIVVELQDLSSIENENTFFYAPQTYESLQDEIEIGMKNPGKYEGVSTGFPQLDFAIGGLQKGKLYTLAALTGRGKTALAVNILDHVVKTSEYPGLLFSMEMRKEDIAGRYITRHSTVPITLLKAGKHHQPELDKIDQVVKRGKESNYYMDTKQDITLQQIEQRCKQMIREHGGISLIVLDYIQFMENPDPKLTTTQYVTKVANFLTALCKKMKVPVILVAQLNRNTSNRADPIPMLSDLKDSSAIEHNSDVVMFLYHKDAENYRHEVTLRLEKNRSGAPQTEIDLIFNGARFMFVEGEHTQQY